MILPDAAWRQRPGLSELCRTLDVDVGAARFVGGAVRDTLLGIDVHDIDIATRLAPVEAMDRLRAAGIRAVPTGIAHGTITAILADGPVEITTLRRDISTDGRHAEIAFTDDWREDAARRDFTINALYADPVSGALFDYYGGLDDLQAGIVRFIGDPLLRIAEDHLRILRFFRFVSRFGAEIDGPALAACRSRANDLMALSRERIADELLKLLVTRNAASTIALMIANGILAPVLPEIMAADRLATVVMLEQALDLAPDPIRRLAALLPDDARMADAIGARLKLSNAQRKRLIAALEGSADGMIGANPRALAYRLGTIGAIDRLMLHGDPIESPSAIAAVRDWPIPRLGIGGGMLVARGIGQGPDVARTLRAIEAQWIAEDFPNGDRISAIADAAIDQTLRSISRS